MERAPIPPHERTWRHPSEIGATLPVGDNSTSHRALALTGGALAVALVAALVITMTPRASTNPVAISATTLPNVDRSGEPSRRSSAVQAVRIAAVNAIPSAIAAIPNLDLPDLLDGESTLTMSSALLPDLTDEVLVLSDHYAYAVPWRDVALLNVDGNGVVFGADGSLIARFVEGRLVVMADTRVGAAWALTADSSDLATSVTPAPSTSLGGPD